MLTKRHLRLNTCKIAIIGLCFAIASGCQAPPVTPMQCKEGYRKGYLTANTCGPVVVTSDDTVGYYIFADTANYTLLAQQNARFSKSNDSISFYCFDFEPQNGDYVRYADCWGLDTVRIVPGKLARFYAIYPVTN